ncbi:Arginine--tRNA ligase [Planctomycetales bacterium 10988]|nr:Arginine--tRNA ligase [Planctomycetales bacterium 10988]
MNILATLQDRFRQAFEGWIEDYEPLVELVRPGQNPKFCDYQANCAMPMKQQLGQPPREIAAEIVKRLEIEDICEPPEIAGPGFINLRLKESWLAEQLVAAGQDERVGVPTTETPQTVIIDYSSPNVAKPMHVGHIRSTVIGDSLYRIRKFLGHNVISDNHIGDWGTQFGMIIYGYRHFVDQEAFAKSPVEELGRLYQWVRKIMDYQALEKELPDLQAKTEQAQVAWQKWQEEHPESDKPTEKKAAKKWKQERKAAEQGVTNFGVATKEASAKYSKLKESANLIQAAEAHPNIAQKTLEETAKLHAGDAENKRFWEEFLPPCIAAIEEVYERLDVTFDHTLGESFYHDRLPQVVEDLKTKGIAKPTEGAIGVFLPEQDIPFLIQKKDGAFLYATTDLATIQYRQEQWQPDQVLYVVDHRQSQHFELLFATAKKWGYDETDFRHVSFGTVLGDDGRPFKTRAGDAVGLEGLLDEAVRRARGVVDELMVKKKEEGEEVFPESELQEIAETVGIAAVKYADLSQSRSSDYVFSYDKMVATKGNTATYMQYSYARCSSILRKSGETIDWQIEPSEMTCQDPNERQLAIKLLQFPEVLNLVLVDDRPNLLTAYLFELAKLVSAFYEACPVLKADTEAERKRRLLLCDLVARVLKTGLGLLGISVVKRM